MTDAFFSPLKISKSTDKPQGDSGWDKLSLPGEPIILLCFYCNLVEVNGQNKFVKSRSGSILPAAISRNFNQSGGIYRSLFSSNGRTGCPRSD